MTGSDEFARQTGHDNSTNTPRAYWLLPVGAAVLFFGLLFLLDFPKPGLDDLFCIGASLNLANGGDLSNPLVARQDFPSHFYFIHPPTYSLALAGWLKVAGVSTSALLGFEWLMYLLICTATVALLRQYNVRLFMAWLVPLGAAAAFLPEGLRPESFSVALTLGGFALIVCGGNSGFRIFSGFLLMILGASSAERLSFFSAALGVAAVIDLRKRNVPILRSLLFAGSAGLIVSAALMYSIGFKLGEFWRTFHLTASGKVSGGGIASLVGFFRQISVIQWPAALLFFAILPLARFLSEKRITSVTFLLFGAFLVTAVIGALGHGAVWYMILPAFFMTVTGVRRVPKKLASYFPAVLAAVLLVANSRNFIYIIGMLSGKIKSEKGDQLAEAQALRATPQHPVLIDSETARYVFDCRMAPGFLDWSFSSRFPGSLPMDDGLRPDDIYVIGPGSVDWLNLKTHLNLQVPAWKPLGPRKTFHEFPRWAYIIRPQQCGEIRRDGRK